MWKIIRFGALLFLSLHGVGIGLHNSGLIHYPAIGFSNPVFFLTVIVLLLCIYLLLSKDEEGVDENSILKKRLNAFYSSKLFKLIIILSSAVLVYFNIIQKL